MQTAHEMILRMIPKSEIANYTEQKLPHFKGNRLIEALPPSLSPEDLVNLLSVTPEFDRSQQELSASDRKMMLSTLQNCMVPLARHVELCESLDGLLRNGYVGREPLTAGHSKIFKEIHNRDLNNTCFRDSMRQHTAQLSTAVIGLSGMGKTTTVRRWVSHLPSVIYHPDFNNYQVPALHIEMPSDGASVKGLAFSILHQLDTLLPGSDYFRQYSGGGRVGADALMRNVARLMNIHCVGILICDEVQNLNNSSKGARTVMTELVSACNELKVPIVFIGTNEAADILSHNFRQARRSAGNGVAYWDRLRNTPNTIEQREWLDFIEVLWGYQWLKTPTPFSEDYARLMYFFSQGIIDVAIKLFTSAQIRAINTGAEALSPELINAVYEDEFFLMHDMLQGLREGNLKILKNYRDICPIQQKERVMVERQSGLFKPTAKPQPFFDEGNIEPQPAKGEEPLSLQTGISQIPQNGKRSSTKSKSRKKPAGVLVNGTNKFHDALFEAQRNGIDVSKVFEDCGLAGRLDDILLP